MDDERGANKWYIIDPNIDPNIDQNKTDDGFTENIVPIK
jgi:hypothetical protein